MELKQRKYDFLALVILGVMFFLAVGSMREDSAIRDEMPHIVAGYSYITQADYRLNPEHPPLVKQLSALPLLFMKINFPKEDAGWKYNVNDQWSLGDTFLYKSGNDADKMLFWARIPIVILMLLAGFVVYLWASEIFKNKLAGFLALLLYAFSPNIIAHGRFITTDMGVTAFSVFALYSWWKFLKEPGWSKFLIAALLQGCLHLAKFSSPILLPIIGIMTIFAIFSYSKQWGAKKRWAIYLASVMSATIIAFLLVGVWYKIFMREMPLDVQQRLIAESIWDDQFGNAGLATKLINLSNIEALRPYVQYALGFFMVAAHASYGHSTYFMGDVGQNWPEYYFIAYLLKEPLASQIILYTFLISLIAGLFAFIKGEKRKEKIKIYFEKYNILVSFAILTAIFLFMGMTAKLQLGIRYIVLIFPYLYIILGGFLALKLEQIKKAAGRKSGAYRAGAAMVIFLFIWLIWSNLRTYPLYLPYYNELIGGGKNGWLYLIDSNTDWGQDLRRLKKWADKNKITNLKIDYFGGGNLDYYFGPGNYTTWGFEKGETKGWLAVSVDAIQWNTKNSEEQGNYHWLTDNYAPQAMIGNSILVYKID